MSAKLKIFLVLILGIFATTFLVGIYIIKQWHSHRLSTDKDQEQITAHNISNQNLVVNKSRTKIGRAHV